MTDSIFVATWRGAKGLSRWKKAAIVTADILLVGVLGYFLLAVEDVLEDAAAEWEGGMRITGALRYEPAPTLAEPWARATLAALAEPRARA